MHEPQQPGLVPGAGVRPVRSTADVLAQLDELLTQEEDSDPIRDAIVAGLTALLFSCEEWAEYACAQADLLRSTDRYQDTLAEDRGFSRAAEELDQAFLARFLAVPKVVTLEAIREAVNTILASYTTGQCQVFEPGLDCWFVKSKLDASAWHSFLDATPRYPDRLYTVDEPFNGASIPNGEPGGAWVFSRRAGRRIVVRIPDLSPLNGDQAVLLDQIGVGTPPVLAQTYGVGFFPGDGTNADLAAYPNSEARDANAVYDAIALKLGQIVGQGVYWLMTTDPRL